MKLPIIGYNNITHSNTKHTPFEILSEHLNQTLFFVINEEKYVHNHTKIIQQILKIFTKLRRHNIY